MVLQLGAGREQKAWQSFGDWHLVSESPSFFCSSLSAHFHPSIPSLFNWLPVKVLLSASTCPCHSKQRQPGDTALSLSCLCSLFSPCLLLLLSFLFCLLLISSNVSPLLPLASLPPCSFFIQTFSFCFSLILSHPFSYPFSMLVLAFPGLVTNSYHHCLCCAPRYYPFFFLYFAVIWAH